MVDEVKDSVPLAPQAVESANSATVEAVAPVASLTPTSEKTPSIETKVETTPEKTESKDVAKEEPKKVETLLAGDKKIEEKPAELKTDSKVETKTEEKPAEVKTEQKVELPKYEAFKLPEGVTVDDAKMGDFTKMLGDFETTTKASHEEIQKLGQQMVDRHVSELKEGIDRYTKSLTDAWHKQASDWKDSFLKSPEFANRHDTVLNSAIDAINVYGGDTKQQQEFRDLMESSKVGNHPAMIRLLSNIMLAKAEPKPLAAPTIAPKESGSRIEKMYGKKKA